MSQLQEYAKLISYLVWLSLFSVLCFHWCRGVIDGKSMIKFCSIIFAIGIGYTVFGYFVKDMSFGNDYDSFKCVDENNAYYSCMGWPIFKEASTFRTEGSKPFLLHVAELVTSAIDLFYAFAKGYASIIAAMFLYVKLSRGLWSGEIRQIFYAFFGGIIIFVSLEYCMYFQKLFMDISLYLFGFENHIGGNANLITNVASNLQNWDQSLKNLAVVQKDMGLFSSTAIRQLPEFLIAVFLRAIVQLPLIWFSLLNICMMIMHHFMLLSLPVDAIKMSMSINADPLIIIRKLLAMSMLSLAIVTEFQFLNWIPSPPTATVVAFGGAVVGGLIGLFWSGIIILIAVIFGSVFSGIAIFHSFKVGKSAMESA